MPLITRWLPVTNFVIATTALCFQVGVLYPWHKELDHSFDKLKKEHLMVLDLMKRSAQVGAAQESILEKQQLPKEASRKAS